MISLGYIYQVESVVYNYEKNIIIFSSVVQKTLFNFGRFYPWNSVRWNWPVHEKTWLLVFKGGAETEIGAKSNNANKPTLESFHLA